MNIFPRNEKTYAVLEYFVVTEIDENQESCLRKEKIIRVCDYSDEDERTCLKCIVLDLSIKYIRKFHDDVMETLDHNGVMIGVPVFNLPAKEKYPRDIILNPDIFRQETK